MAANPTDPVIGNPLEPPRRNASAWFIATFFGAGFLRPGPGTWASLGTAFFWSVAAYTAITPARQWFYCTVAAAIVLIIGVPLSSIVARESGLSDPQFVVIDEVAGQLIALIAVPVRWQYVLVSLILFRVFDISKPPPLRQLEKLPEGSGIMLDDVGAGFYALIVIQLLLHYRILR